MIITVQYHREPEGVWADSPDVEGLAVAGTTLAEVRQLVREGLEFYVDGEEIDLREALADAPAPVIDFTFEARTSAAFYTSGFGVSTGQAGHPTLTAAPASPQLHEHTTSTSGILENVS